MAPLRPLPSLFDVATCRWISSSRLQPGHAFHIQRRLFHGTKIKKRALSPYRDVDWSLRRKENLTLLSFPRKYPSFRANIIFTILAVPRVLPKLFYYGGRYLFIWRPHSQEKKGLLYDYFSQPGCLAWLNWALDPWGTISLMTGMSMHPTLSAKPSISYLSYCYVNKRDVRRGDVVGVLGPKYADALCKRVAALEGDRILVTGCNEAGALQRIVSVPKGYCFLVGDNSSCSLDSRRFGPVPIEAIRAKVRWQLGPDGIRWPKHGREPWLKNKAIVHLAPGQNRPTSDEPLIAQPEKSPTVVPRFNEKPLPSPPPPPKKQQTANKQQKAKQQQKEKQQQKAEQRQKAKQHKMAKQQQKDRRKKR